jgi:hypothetical protein
MIYKIKIIFQIYGLLLEWKRKSLFENGEESPFGVGLLFNFR